MRSRKKGTESLPSDSDAELLTPIATIELVEPVGLIETVTQTEQGEIHEIAELLEVVDIEIYARSGQAPPRARTYRIRIDREYYEVDRPRMTGRDLLILAGKEHPERYLLSQRDFVGGVRPIGLEENADFTAPGIERFMTLPLDQTEG